MIYTILIIPVLMMVVGYLMFKYPPRRINYFVGYRTLKSMKNEKMWKVANQYCGKVWEFFGIIMLIFSLILIILANFKIFIFTENFLLIVIFGELGIMLMSIILVENKISNL